MPYFTVDLREPHSFMTIWLGLACALFVIALALAAFTIWKMKQERDALKGMQVKNMTLAELNALKERYLQECSKLEETLHETNDIRMVYQRLSEISRMFVSEATGLKVQNCTLSQIRKMKLPQLREMVEEYYDPEFAVRSTGDVEGALAKTERMITRWTVFQ